MDILQNNMFDWKTIVNNEIFNKFTNNLLQTLELKITNSFDFLICNECYQSPILMEENVIIDGSLLQGGGQMVRSSLVLASIFGKSLQIHSIRKNRSNPGINNQLKSLFHTFTNNIPNIGDTQIKIIPYFTEQTVIKSSTASSITLMLQCLIPVLIALGYTKQIKVQGGTDVSKSPCMESFCLGLIPLMKKMGVELEISSIKNGEYPQGNGYIIFSVKAKQYISPIDLTEFNPPNKVEITYYLKQNKSLNENNSFGKQIQNILIDEFPKQKFEINIKIHKVRGTKINEYGIGCMILGNGVVWDCGKVGEKVSQSQIIDKLKFYSKSKVCLDEHHQDQLILLAALATGISRLRVGTKLTQHSLSLLYVIKQFIPEFKYDHQDEILSIQGIGYQCGKGQLAASKTEFNKKEDLHE